MNAGALYGRSIAFPPRLGPDGHWAWSEGPRNIRESIQIIMLTEAGQRLMLPSFGAGLERFLYEPNTAATRRLIQERVETALRLWEPRIRLRAVTVEEEPGDAGRAVVSVEYELVALQSVDRIALTVDLGR
jgi:phage baseplate assembly protein W